MKMLKTMLLGSMLGVATLMPMSPVLAGEEGGAWHTGGLATNTVSSGVADTQKNLSTALAINGILTNLGAMYGSLIPQNFVGDVIFDNGVGHFLWPHAGTTGFGFNFDLLGAALDGMLLYDAMTKETSWSEDIPELEATQRLIGSPEDLEGECEKKEGEEGGSGVCNETTAPVNHTEVYVQSVKNVGLEALADVAGSVLKTVEEIIGALGTVQTGFATEGTAIERKQAALDNVELRRAAHLQLTGTAGVARADISHTVAKSEKKKGQDRLQGYVGRGANVVANIKILAGFDLSLSQRLNLLNMLQGQQSANEAAVALQFMSDE